MTDAPFNNCQFRECDLPGQCRSEGKCHHPRADDALYTMDQMRDYADAFHLSRIRVLVAEKEAYERHAPAVAGASEGQAFEWPQLPELPMNWACSGYDKVYAAHQMHYYASAYGESVRAKLSAEIAALRERIAELESFYSVANDRIEELERDIAAYREAGVWEPDGKKFMTYRNENLNGKAMYVKEPKQ